MLNKELVKEKFKKSINYYDNNAVIQKKTAHDLISYLNEKKYSSILEIGSYTGLLTKELVKKVEFENYLALDIIDSSDNLKNLNIKFKKADIELFNTSEKFDLIISNAALQWCNDFFKTLEKLKTFQNKNGLLIISVFSKGNLYEIKETFNTGLDYPGIDKIKKIFPLAQIIEKEYTLQFNTPLDILKHLKYTGVNSLTKKNYKISDIKNKLDKLDKVYCNKITYKPLYIINQYL